MQRRPPLSPPTGRRPIRCRNASRRARCSAPGNHRHAGLLGCEGRRHGHRKLADADAVAGVVGDLLFGAVVVAGQRDGAAGNAVQQGAPVRLAQPRPLVLQLQDAAFDIGVVQPAAAAQRAIEVEVGVLADTRAVVHQADHAHARMIRHRIEQVQHVGGRHFAAQMQVVVALHQRRFGQRIHRHAIAEGADAFLVEPEIAQAQRIQHRGDAGGGALRVMRHHRRTRRPAGQRTRLHLAFEIVGVHIDNAGNQVVAVEIDRRR